MAGFFVPLDTNSVKCGIWQVLTLVL